MANYYAVCRSNYFQVRDPRAFRARMSALGVDVVPTEDGHTIFAEGWPSYDPTAEVPDPSQCGEEFDPSAGEIDFVQELAKHLQDGEVAILMESGHEARRYVTGQAIAVNAKGQTESIDLADIYEKAVALAPIGTMQVSRAEY